MTKKPLLSVIIASYNDNDIIEPYYREISRELAAQSHYDWELIYVDDGSTDSSVETLAKLSRSDSRVALVELARNFGQQKGFLAGMKQAQGDIVITLDGDAQYYPETLIKLANRVSEGFDVVSGVRSGRQDPWRARIASWFGRYFVSHAIGMSIHDFGAVKGFSRFVIRKIMDYENYCIVPYGMAYALTNRTSEIAVPHRERMKGKSKWNFNKRVQLYFDLFLAHSSYENSRVIPVATYLMATGFAFAAMGLILMLPSVIAASVFTIALGACLILASFFMSFMMRIYRQRLWSVNSSVARNIYKNEFEKTC